MLRSWLFTIPEEPRHWRSIIAWWELRRLVYNAIMFVAGVVGLLVFGLFDYLYTLAHPGAFDDWVPLLSVFVAAFGANLFYTGGWISELIARPLWRDRARYYGPIMLSLGLILSLAVCFLPSILLGITLIVWVVVHKVT